MPSGSGRPSVSARRSCSDVAHERRRIGVGGEGGDGDARRVDERRRRAVHLDAQRQHRRGLSGVEARACLQRAAERVEARPDDRRAAQPRRRVGAGQRLDVEERRADREEVVALDGRRRASGRPRSRTACRSGGPRRARGSSSGSGAARLPTADVAPPPSGGDGESGVSGDGSDASGPAAAGATRASAGRAGREREPQAGRMVIVTWSGPCTSGPV